MEWDVAASHGISPGFMGIGLAMNASILCRGMYEVASTHQEAASTPDTSPWTWTATGQWVTFFALQAVGEPRHFGAMCKLRTERRIALGNGGKRELMGSREQGLW